MKAWICKHNKGIIAAFASIVVFILYYPVLHAPFLLDDYSSIVDNPAIRLLDLKKIYLFEPLRFLGYLSIALNFSFSKLDPFSYHMVNIAIHIIYVNVYFLFLQVLWLTPSGKSTDFSDTEKKYISMAAALLIAVHPMSAFSVSYIVQRLAALTAVFYISSLFFYLKIRLADSILSRVLYGFCFGFFLLCALFTKQNAFTVFPVIMLMELWCFKNSVKKTSFVITAFVVLFISFILLALFDQIDINEIRRITCETKNITRFEYLITEFSVVCFYLAQLFFPNRLALDYQYTVQSSFFTPDVIVPLIIIAIVIGFAIFAGVKRNLRNLRLCSFGILFYFITISVESSVIPIRDPIFIHRTYLPHAGMFFAVVVLIYFGMKQIKIPLFLSVGVLSLSVFLCIGATWKTNHMFQSPIKVWQRVLALSPDYPRGHVALGREWLAKGELKKASNHIVQAYRLRPKNHINLNNLGIVHRKTKQYDKAVVVFKKTIELKKNYTEAYTNLGNTYADMKKYNLAIETYKLGYKYDKDNFKNLLNLGQLLAFTADESNTEQLNNALGYLSRAEQINDKHPVVFYSKAIALYRLNRYEQAEQNLLKSLYYRPNFEQAIDLLKKTRVHSGGRLDSRPLVFSLKN